MTQTQVLERQLIRQSQAELWAARRQLDIVWAQLEPIRARLDAGYGYRSPEWQRYAALRAQLLHPAWQAYWRAWQELHSLAGSLALVDAVPV